jgi:ABC-type dipeptide/oligopeptide/nickel transport system permease component
MLRFAFRRMLWVFPSVIGVSLVTFYLLSLVPRGDAVPTTEQERRRAFDDLPLFVNLSPRDIRSRVEVAEEAIIISEHAPGEMSRERGQTELVRLGGAALPVLLPELDELHPSERVRIALALAPLAERMQLDDDAGATRDPERVVVFWNRFWAARGVEFRPGTAASAVRRYARYGTDARAEQLRLLDTYALPAMIDALEEPEGILEVERARRIASMISHVTGREGRIAPDATPAEASEVVRRWKRWWMVYETDFVRLSGAARVAAFATQTRYGKWAYEAVALELGIDRRGRPLLEELWRRGKVTFTILSLGLALAYLLAIPLGSIAAWWRGGPLDRAIAAIVLVPYAASPALLVTAALGFGARMESGMTWAVVLLAVAVLADPTRQLRAELLPVLAEDYVRAALARGSSRLRVLLVHGLRNALLPVVTRAALELPVALTGCFVLEAALGLDGLGEATVSAVMRHDHRWLMALAVSGAAWSVLALVFTDVAYAVLDPRLRSALAPQRRRHA